MAANFGDVCDDSFGFDPCGTYSVNSCTDLVCVGGHCLPRSHVYFEAFELEFGALGYPDPNRLAAYPDVPLFDQDLLDTPGRFFSQSVYPSQSKVASFEELLANALRWFVYGISDVFWDYASAYLLRPATSQAYQINFERIMQQLIGAPVTSGSWWEHRGSFEYRTRRFYGISSPGSGNLANDLSMLSNEYIRDRVNLHMEKGLCQPEDNVVNDCNAIFMCSQPYGCSTVARVNYGNFLTYDFPSAYTYADLLSHFEPVLAHNEAVTASLGGTITPFVFYGGTDRAFFHPDDNIDANPHQLQRVLPSRFPLSNRVRSISTNYARGSPPSPYGGTPINVDLPVGSSFEHFWVAQLVAIIHAGTQYGISPAVVATEVSNQSPFPMPDYFRFAARNGFPFARHAHADSFHVPCVTIYPCTCPSGYSPHTTMWWRREANTNELKSACFYDGTDDAAFVGTPAITAHIDQLLLAKVSQPCWPPEAFHPCVASICRPREAGDTHTHCGDVWPDRRPRDRVGYAETCEAPPFGCARFNNEPICHADFSFTVPGNPHEFWGCGFPTLTLMNNGDACSHSTDARAGGLFVTDPTSGINGAPFDAYTGLPYNVGRSQLPILNLGLPHPSFYGQFPNYPLLSPCLNNSDCRSLYCFPGGYCTIRPGDEHIVVGDTNKCGALAPYPHPIGGFTCRLRPNGAVFDSLPLVGISASDASRMMCSSQEASLVASVNGSNAIVTCVACSAIFCTQPWFICENGRCILPRPGHGRVGPIDHKLNISRSGLPTSAPSPVELGTIFPQPAIEYDVRCLVTRESTVLHFSDVGGERSREWIGTCRSVSQFEPELATINDRAARAAAGDLDANLFQARIPLGSQEHIQGECVPTRRPSGYIVPNTHPRGSAAWISEQCNVPQCNGDGAVNFIYRPPGYACSLTGTTVDTNGCTDSACDGAGSCVATTRPAGTLCDDGIPCTHGDMCNGNGTCVGIPSVAPGSSCILCTQNSDCACTHANQCDIAKGVCVGGTPLVAGSQRVLGPLGVQYTAAERFAMNLPATLPLPYMLAYAPTDPLPTNAEEYAWSLPNNIVRCTRPAACVDVLIGGMCYENGVCGAMPTPFRWQDPANAYDETIDANTQILATYNVLYNNYVADNNAYTAYLAAVAAYNASDPLSVFPTPEIFQPVPPPLPTTLQLPADLSQLILDFLAANATYTTYLAELEAYNSSDPSATVPVVVVQPIEPDGVCIPGICVADQQDLVSLMSIGLGQQVLGGPCTAPDEQTSLACFNPNIQATCGPYADGQAANGLLSCNAELLPVGTPCPGISDHVCTPNATCRSDGSCSELSIFCASATIEQTSAASVCLGEIYCADVEGSAECIAKLAATGTPCEDECLFHEWTETDRSLGTFPLPPTPNIIPGGVCWLGKCVGRHIQCDDYSSITGIATSRDSCATVTCNVDVDLSSTRPIAPGYNLSETESNAHKHCQVLSVDLSFDTGNTDYSEPCDDGLSCTGPDTCNGELTCQGGAQIPCESSVELDPACAFILSTCDSLTGNTICTQVNHGVLGTPCAGDGLACTISECDGNGFCINTPKDCNVVTNTVQCGVTIGACNEEAGGICEVLPDPSPLAGRSCDDQDDCTHSDFCTGVVGVCEGTPHVCTTAPQFDPNPSVAVLSGCADVNAGTCIGIDASSGRVICTYPTLPVGTECVVDKPALSCPTTDSCDAAGQCVIGPPIPCPPPAVDSCRMQGVCDASIGGVCIEEIVPDDPAVVCGTAATGWLMPSVGRCRYGVCTPGCHPPCNTAIGESCTIDRFNPAGITASCTLFLGPPCALDSPSSVIGCLDVICMTPQGYSYTMFRDFQFLRWYVGCSKEWVEIFSKFGSTGVFLGPIAATLAITLLLICCSNPAKFCCRPCFSFCGNTFTRAYARRSNHRKDKNRFNYHTPPKPHTT